MPDPSVPDPERILKAFDATGLFRPPGFLRCLATSLETSLMLLVTAAAAIDHNADPPARVAEEAVHVRDQSQKLMWYVASTMEAHNAASDPHRRFHFDAAYQRACETIEDECEIALLATPAAYGAALHLAWAVRHYAAEDPDGVARDLEDAFGGALAAYAIADAYCNTNAYGYVGDMRPAAGEDLRTPDPAVEEAKTAVEHQAIRYLNTVSTSRTIDTPPSDVVITVFRGHPPKTTTLPSPRTVGFGAELWMQAVREHDDLLACATVEFYWPSAPDDYRGRAVEITVEEHDPDREVVIVAELSADPNGNVRIGQITRRASGAA